MIKIETTKTNIFFVDDIIFFNREKNETIKFFIDRIKFYNQRKNKIPRIKLSRNRSKFKNYHERDVFIDNLIISFYDYNSQTFEHLNMSINYSKFDIYITIKKVSSIRRNDSKIKILLIRRNDSIIKTSSIRRNNFLANHSKIKKTQNQQI